MRENNQGRKKLGRLLPTASRLGIRARWRRGSAQGKFTREWVTSQSWSAVSKPDLVSRRLPFACPQNSLEGEQPSRSSLGLLQASCALGAGREAPWTRKGIPFICSDLCCIFSALYWQILKLCKLAKETFLYLVTRAWPNRMKKGGFEAERQYIDWFQHSILVLLL